MTGDQLPGHVVLRLYTVEECAGCGHVVVDDGTETTGHFVDNGDRSVGLDPHAGCYVAGCPCPGPMVGLDERTMIELHDLRRRRDERHRLEFRGLIAPILAAKPVEGP